MEQRPHVASVRSDDGTLVRLYSRAFGMAGGIHPRDLKLQSGGVAAREAASKLAMNHEAVIADVCAHAPLGGTAGRAAAGAPQRRLSLGILW